MGEGYSNSTTFIVFRDNKIGATTLCFVNENKQMTVSSNAL